MKRFATLTSGLLVAIEWLLTALPFLLSWFLCAIVNAVVLGWTISRMTSAEKRATLSAWLGGE